MARRFSKNLMWLLTLLFVSAAGLWAVSWWADPERHSWSLGEHCYIGAFDGCLELYSDSFGPYHGGIIALDGQRIPWERHGFRVCGLYYCFIKRLDTGGVLWTVSVSLWYPMLLFGLLPAICRWKQWRRSGFKRPTPDPKGD